MWNEEDNNPYGSFDRNENNTSPFERPISEPSDNGDESPEYIPKPGDLNDDDQPRKKGGYDSRIEQTLCENSDLEIFITEAGKSHESGGGYIVYTIRTGDLEVRRRYSEFASLRSTLVSLHPTLIIPPIPEKHSMADYAAKPTKAKQDMSIIELRKRMLAVFLNRCRKMKDVREDGVWWRFLDPNASWNEVLNSAIIQSIPKSNMRAPPLDPSHPTIAHQWLPIPSASAKLKSATSTSATGTPTSPPNTSISSAAHAIPGPQIFGRFPPTTRNLSESELDPYFTSFESSTRELEALLQGNIERVNRRTLSHLNSLSTDMAELGARYNAFSLSEQSQTVAAAIERVGQAVDSSYLATEELSSTLGANFAEPMRESAQFASVVRSVLRYRILKRVQEEMTKDELEKKRILLESLARSENEAKRMESYLTSNIPRDRRRSASEASSRSQEDTASIDSDFPPTHAESPASPSNVSTPQRSRSQGGGGMTNKILGRISHAMHGFVDVDPERTRRDQIGKTRESISHLKQALQVSDKDVKDASSGVLKDLQRFQYQKEEDLKRYTIAYAKCHIDWAKKNLEAWKEAVDEVGKIEVR